MAATLSEVAEVMMGQSPPGSTYNTEGVGLPFIQGSAEFGTRSPWPTKWCSSPRRIAQSGDILISIRAPVGDLNFAAGPLAIGRGVAIVRARSERVLPVYLALTLEQCAPEMRQRSGGTMFESINRDSLTGQRLILPPLAVQRRIVDLMAAIDLATWACEHLVAASVAAAGAVLRQSVDSASTSVKLGEVATVRGGKRLPKGTPWAATATPHQYIRVLDLQNGSVNERSIVFVPETVWPAIRKYVVVSNDVIVSIVGTIGEVALVPNSLDGANLTENAALIRVHDELDPAYLAAFLRSDRGRAEIVRLTVGTTQKKLALFRLEAIEVPVLALDHQRTVALLHGAMEDVGHRALEQSRMLEDLRSALVTNLLLGDHEIPAAYDRFLDGAA